jgi:PAP2 superfamily
VKRFLAMALVALGSSLFGSSLTLPTSSARAQSSKPQLETKIAMAWYDLALELVRHTPTYSPPVASRAFGYLGVVLFEAVADDSSSLRSLSGQLRGFSRTLAPDGLKVDRAVMMHAALSHTVKALFANVNPTGQRALEAINARLTREVSASADATTLSLSVARGQAIAGAVLEWAKTDGGSSIANLGFPLSYPQATEPSQWVPTAALALQQVPLLPTWGQNRPLVLESGGACPIASTVPYSEEQNSSFYAEALEVYTTAQNLTKEQRAIARFWSDDPMLTSTPPGHWVGIVVQLAKEQSWSLETFAEAQARVGIAVNDAFIGCWHEKYKYNLLRPITYIRRFIDPTWEALLITPPFPEYPSGHSTQSAAAATVLTAMLGEDYAFTDRTHEADGLEARSFKSFWEAANEAAISRLYGGIHYRSGIEQGLEQGRCIGERVNALRFRN